MSPRPILTFHGVRGSAATAGSHIARYGGNTTCIEIDPGDRSRIVIDGGTGLRRLQHHLPDPGDDGFGFDVFFTHYHWDHIEGLPFFRPLYDERNTFRFHGPAWSGGTVTEALSGGFRPPWFPVAIDDLTTAITYATVDEAAVTLGPITIRATGLHHPQGVTAYRVETARCIVVIATDHEAGDPDADDELRRFAAGCDVLVHDAQYTTAQYRAGHVGWGHSTWRHAVDAAKAIRPRKLITVSHDPDRSDDQLDRLETLARTEFSMTSAGYEGMQIEL